jgi:hypothetical protein
LPVGGRSKRGVSAPPRSVEAGRPPVMAEEGGTSSTLADVRPVELGPRSVRGRTAIVALLLVIVIAGALGLLGVRSTTVTATSGGYTLSVTYAWIARAGLDVPWSVELHRDGGFDGPVTVAVTGEYFDIYEEQGLDPEPATQTADAQAVYWTFDPPPGDTLGIDFDAYIQPASQWGASGTVAVLEGGQRVVSVGFTTALVP